MEARPQAELRDYLAAERTFLAWIRTGLALMGFGFVVARFGLFLQQLQVLQTTPAASRTGLSLWFGTALIAGGVIMDLSAARQYARIVRELDKGQPPRGTPLSQNVAVALFLAFVGIAMATYLLSVRRSLSVQSGNIEETQLASITKGITDKPSNHSVEETVNRIETMLQAKGVTLFALIDHSGEAEKVGLKMRPTKLLIFGSPKAGTPLMLAAPSVAIDLPLKILVWEDNQGKVWISYNNPEYLKERHGLPQELVPNITMVETLTAKAGE